MSKLSNMLKSATIITDLSGTWLVYRSWWVVRSVHCDTTTTHVNSHHPQQFIMHSVVRTNCTDGGWYTTVHPYSINWYAALFGCDATPWTRLSRSSITVLIFKWVFATTTISALHASRSAARCSTAWALVMAAALSTYGASGTLTLICWFTAPLDDMPACLSVWDVTDFALTLVKTRCRLLADVFQLMCFFFRKTLEFPKKLCVS